MDRLLIVSNRLPVSVTQTGTELEFKPSVGGVATGLSSLKSPLQTCWIGWPGIAWDRLTDLEEQTIADRLARVPGVSYVWVWGGQKAEMQVVVDCSHNVIRPVDIYK